ncbi:MAG TPA: hypothetical protein VMP01_01915 [Pirellulaceae bacterium]|nr:hypothetical protein [Pirellulaceae bacterium]
MPFALANLTPLSQRLAKNNRRVSVALDRLPTIVQQLVAAFLRRDQRSLRELSQHLATVAAGQPALAEIALKLQAHAESRRELPLQRSLLALVGEVAGLRQRGIVAAAALPSAESH